MKACGISTRRRRPRSKARQKIPILERLGLLLPGLRLHDRARRPSGPSNGATGSPSSRSRYGSRYMLAFCRAEYGAVHLWRGQWAEAETLLEASARGFFALTAALGGRSSRRAGRAEAAPGRAGRGRRRCSTGPGAGPGGAALPRPAGARRRRRASGPSSSLERLLRQLPAAPEARPRSRRSSCSSVHGSPRGELDEAARGASRHSAEIERAGRHVAAARLRRSRRGHARRGAGRPRTGPAAAGGRRRSLRAKRRARSRRRRRRIELATSLVALGRTDAADARRSAAAGSTRSSSARQPRPSGRVGSSPRPASGDCIAPGAHPPRAGGACACSPRGSRTARSRTRLVISEHTVHRHVTNILRKLDLPSRTAAAAHAARPGLLDA